MIKGAIFDFDGTLVDSMFIWDTFGEDYLRTLGKEPRENLTETFKTFTLEQAAEYYREHCGVTLSVGEIVDGVNEMVSEIYRTKVALKKGVLEFLRDLRSKGVKMCVATVTDRPIVEDVLKKLGIRDFFTEICFSISLKLLKNHSGDFLRCECLTVDGYLIVGTHFSLDGHNRFVGVCYCLSFCNGTDKSFTCFGERNNGGCCSRAFGIGDNDGLGALENGDTRVGRTKVDTDNLCHNNFLHITAPLGS